MKSLPLAGAETASSHSAERFFARSRTGVVEKVAVAPSCGWRNFWRRWAIVTCVQGDSAACEQFLVSQYPRMLREAYLLTGNRHAAQDLVQDAAVLVVDKWRRVENASDRVAYTRRLLLNVFLAGRKRRWRGEIPTGELPDTGADAPYADVDARDQLRRGLLRLPPRQRAAVVARHYQQLSEAEAASALGCSIGTVKSLTSRGAAALCDLLEPLETP